MDSRADVVAIAHALTYVIWLRLANVRLPPFVSSWQCCDPLELDDLHQVGHECELCRENTIREMCGPFFELRMSTSHSSFLFL